MYASSESSNASNVIPETSEVSKSPQKLSHRYLLQYHPSDYIYPWESPKTPQNSMLPERRQLTNRNYRRKFSPYSNINNQNNHPNLRKRWNLFHQKPDSINSSTDRLSTTFSPQQLTTNNNYSSPPSSFTPNYDYNIKNREIPVWQTNASPDQEQSLYQNYDNEQLNSPDYQEQLNDDKNPSKRGFRLLPVSKNLYVLKQDPHDELPADPIDTVNENQRNIELKRSNPGISDETSDLLSFRAHLHHDVRDIGKSFLQRPMKRDELSSASDFIDQNMDLTNPSPDSWRSMSSGQSLEESLPVMNNYQSHQYADPLMNSVDVNEQGLRSYENLYGPMDSTGSLQGLNPYGSQQVPAASYQQIPNELDSAAGSPGAFDQQNFEEYNSLMENNLYDVDRPKNDVPEGHLGYLDKYARAVDSINDRWRDDQGAGGDVLTSLDEGNSPNGGARDLSGSDVSRPMSPELEKVNGTSLAMVIEPLTAQLQKLLSSIQQVNEKLISQNNSVDSSRRKRGADDSGIEDESYDDVDDDEETRDERSDDDDDEEDPCSFTENGDRGCEGSQGVRKHVRNDEGSDLNVEEVTSNFLNNSQSLEVEKTTRRLEETTVINEFREHFVNPDFPNVEKTTRYPFHPEEEEILETIRNNSQQSEETTRKNVISETTSAARDKITENLVDATLKPLDVFQGAKSLDTTFSSVDDLETIKVAVEPTSDNQTSQKLLRTSSKELLMKLLPKEIIQNITDDGIIVRIPGDEVRPNSVVSSTSSSADQRNPVWFFEGEGNIKDPHERLNSRKSIENSPGTNSDEEMKGNDALVAVGDDEEDAGDTKLTIKLRLPNRSHQKAARNVESKEQSKDVEKTLTKRSQPMDDLDEESLDDYRDFDKRNVDTLGNEYVDDSDEDEGEFEDYDDDEPAQDNRNEKRSGKVVDRASESPSNVPKIVLRLRFPESSETASDVPKRSSPRSTNRKKKRQQAVKKSPQNIGKKNRVRIGRSLKWFQDETEELGNRIDRQIDPLDFSGTTEEASESSVIDATALREVTAYSKLADVLTMSSISTESTEAPYSIPVIFREETEGITESTSSSTISSTEAPNPETSESSTPTQMNEVPEFTTSAFFVTLENIETAKATSENPLTSETTESLGETTTEFFPSTETSATSEEMTVSTDAPQEESSSSESPQQTPETGANLISTTSRAEKTEPTTPTTETTFNPPSTSESASPLSTTPVPTSTSTTEAPTDGFTSTSTESLNTTTISTPEVFENITDASATASRGPITETESSTTELFSSSTGGDTLEERESSVTTSLSTESSTKTSTEFLTSTISTLETQTEEVFSTSVRIPSTSETDSLSTRLDTSSSFPTTAQTMENEPSSSLGFSESSTSEETTTLQQTSASTSEETTISTSIGTTEETVMTSLSQSTTTEGSLEVTSNPTVVTEGKLGTMTIPFLTSFSLDRKLTTEGEKTSDFFSLNTEALTTVGTTEISTPTFTMKLTTMFEEATISSGTSVSGTMEMLSTEKLIATTPSLESTGALTETTFGTTSVVTEGTLEAISTAVETSTTVEMKGTSEISSTTAGMQTASERPSTTVEVIGTSESTSTTAATTEGTTEAPTTLEATETSGTASPTTVEETLELSMTTAVAEETVESTPTTPITVAETSTIIPEVIEILESTATTIATTEAATESPTTLKATETSGTAPPTAVEETLELSTTTTEVEETVALTSTTTIRATETSTITPEVIEVSESTTTTTAKTEETTESATTLEAIETSGSAPTTTVAAISELSTTTVEVEETVASTSTTTITVAKTSTTTPEVSKAGAATIVEMNESSQSTLTMAEVPESTELSPTTVEVEKSSESPTSTTTEITPAELTSTTAIESIETSESTLSTTVEVARTSESATAVETEKTQTEFTTELTESTPSQLSKEGTEEPEDEGDLYETEIETEEGPTEEEDEGEQYEDVSEYDEGVTEQWEEVETSTAPSYETSTEAPEERRTEERQTSTPTTSSAVSTSSGSVEEETPESTATETQRTSTESSTTAVITETSESTSTTIATIETSATTPELAETTEASTIEMAESSESTPTTAEILETSGSILATTVEVEETSISTTTEIIETSGSTPPTTTTVKETSKWLEMTVESQETSELRSTTAKISGTSESTPSTTSESTGPSESMLSTTATRRASKITPTTIGEETALESSTVAVETQKISTASSTTAEVPDTSTSLTTVETEITPESISTTIAEEETLQSTTITTTEVTEASGSPSTVAEVETTIEIAETQQFTPTKEEKVSESARSTAKIYETSTLAPSTTEVSETSKSTETPFSPTAEVEVPSTSSPSKTATETSGTSRSALLTVAERTSKSISTTTIGVSEPSESSPTMIETSELVSTALRLSETSTATPATSRITETIELTPPTITEAEETSETPTTTEVSETPQSTLEAASITETSRSTTSTTQAASKPQSPTAVEAEETPEPTSLSAEAETSPITRSSTVVEETSESRGSTTVELETIPESTSPITEVETSRSTSTTTEAMAESTLSTVIIERTESTSSTTEAKSSETTLAETVEVEGTSQSTVATTEMASIETTTSSPLSSSSEFPSTEEASETIAEVSEPETKKTTSAETSEGFFSTQTSVPKEETTSEITEETSTFLTTEEHTKKTTSTEETFESSLITTSEESSESITHTSTREQTEGETEETSGATPTTEEIVSTSESPSTAEASTSKETSITGTSSVITEEVTSSIGMTTTTESPEIEEEAITEETMSTATRIITIPEITTPETSTESEEISESTRTAKFTEKSIEIPTSPAISETQELISSTKSTEIRTETSETTEKISKPKHTSTESTSASTPIPTEEETIPELFSETSTSETLESEESTSSAKVRTIIEFTRTTIPESTSEFSTESSTERQRTTTERATPIPSLIPEITLMSTLTPYSTISTSETIATEESTETELTPTVLTSTSTKPEKVSTLFFISSAEPSTSTEGTSVFSSTFPSSFTTSTEIPTVVSTVIQEEKDYHDTSTSERTPESTTEFVSTIEAEITMEAITTSTFSSSLSTTSPTTALLTEEITILGSAAGEIQPSVPAVPVEMTSQSSMASTSESVYVPASTSILAETELKAESLWTTTETTTPLLLEETGEPEIGDELYEAGIETEGPIEEENEEEQYEGVGEYDEGVSEHWEEMIETSGTPSFGTSTEAPEEQTTEERGTSPSTTSSAAFTTMGSVEEETSESMATAMETQGISTETSTKVPEEQRTKELETRPPTVSSAALLTESMTTPSLEEEIQSPALTSLLGTTSEEFSTSPIIFTTTESSFILTTTELRTEVPWLTTERTISQLAKEGIGETADEGEYYETEIETEEGPPEGEEEEEEGEEEYEYAESETGTEGLTDYFEYEDEGVTHPWVETSTRTPEERITEGKETSILTSEPLFSSRGTSEYLAESEIPGTISETTRTSEITEELPRSSEIILDLPGTTLTLEETGRTTLSFPEVTEELLTSTETVPSIATGTTESFTAPEIPLETFESIGLSLGTSQITTELLQSSEIILTFGETVPTLGEITESISGFSGVNEELSHTTETTPQNLESSGTTSEMSGTIPELSTLGEIIPENSEITPEYPTSSGTLFELTGNSEITAELPRTSTIISLTPPSTSAASEPTGTAAELPTATLTQAESFTSGEMFTESTETVWSSSGTSEQTESVLSVGTIEISTSPFPWETMGSTEQLTRIITEFTGTAPEGSTSSTTPFAVAEASEGTSEVSRTTSEQSTFSEASSGPSEINGMLENVESVTSSPFAVSTSPFPWETRGSTEQLTSIITEYESSSIEPLSELEEIRTAKTTEQWTLGSTGEVDWNAESFPDFEEEYSTTGLGQVGKAETTSEYIPDITLPQILERPEENLEDYSDEYAAEYAELTEETPMIPELGTSVLMMGSTASTPQALEPAFPTGMGTPITTVSYFIASPEGFQNGNEFSLGTGYPGLSEETEAIVPSFFITEQSFPKSEFPLQTSTFPYREMESSGTSQEITPSYPEGYVSTIEAPKFETTESEENEFPQTHGPETSVLFISSGRTTSAPEASSVSILVEGTEAISASSEFPSTESTEETAEESSSVPIKSTTRASIDDVEEELEDREEEQLDRRGRLEKRLRELKEREKALFDQEDDLRRRQEEWEREKLRRQRERERLEEEKRRKKLTTTTTTTEVTTTTVTTTTTTRPTTTTTTTTPTTTTTTTEIPTTTVDYERLKELEEMKKQQEELNDELARMEQEIADKEKELEEKEKRLQEEEDKHQQEKKEFEETWDEQKEEDIAERERELEEREKELDEEEKKLEEEQKEPEEEGSAEIETSSSGTLSSELPSSSEEISSTFEEYSSSSSSSVLTEETGEGTSVTIEGTSVSPKGTLGTMEPEATSTESMIFQSSTTEEEGSGDYIFDDNEDVWKEQPDADREVVNNEEYEEECETPDPTGDDFPTPIMRILENSDEEESDNKPALEESKKSGVEYESATKKLCLHVLDENNPLAYDRSHDYVTQVICMPDPHYYQKKSRTGRASRRRKLLNLEEISTVPIALVEVDVEKRSKDTVQEQKKKPIASLNLMEGEWTYNDTTVALHTPQGFTRIYESWSKVPFEPFNFAEDSTKKGSLVRDETFMRKNFKVNRFDSRIQPTQVNRLSDDEWAEVPTESISKFEASEPDEDEEQSDDGEQSDVEDENRKKKRKRENEDDDDSGPTEYPPEYEENCMLQQHGPWRSENPDLEEPTTSKNEEHDDPVFREPETEDHVDEDVVDVEDDEESTVSPSNDEYEVQEEKDEESESDHEDSDVGRKEEETDNDHDEPVEEEAEENPERDEPSDEGSEKNPNHDESGDESDEESPEEDAEPSEPELKTTREPKNAQTTKTKTLKPPETTTGDYGEIEYFTDDSAPDPDEPSDDYDEEPEEPEWADYESTGEAKKGGNRKREGKSMASLEDLRETKKLLTEKKNALLRREISLKLREKVLKRQEADLQKLKEERRSKRKIQKPSKPVISWPTEGPGRYHLGGHERWEYGLLEDVRKDYKKNKQAFTVNVLQMDYDEDEENHKLKCEEPGKDDLVINQGLVTKAFEDTTLGTTSPISEGTTGNLKLVAGDDSSGMILVDGRTARPSRRTTKPWHPPGTEWPTERTTEFHVGGTRSWDKELLGTPDDTNYRKRRARDGSSYYDDDEPQEVDEEMGTTCYTLILRGGGDDFDMGDQVKWRRDAGDQIERPEEAEEFIPLKPRLRTIKSIGNSEKEESAESMVSPKIQESVQHLEENKPFLMTRKFLNLRVVSAPVTAHVQNKRKRKRKPRGRRRKKNLSRKTFSFDDRTMISVSTNPDSSNVSEVQEFRRGGLGRTLLSMRKAKSPKLQKKPHTAKNKQLPRNFHKKSKSRKNQRVSKREAATSKKSHEKTPQLMSKVMNIIDAPGARSKHQNRKETRSIFTKMKQMINKVIGHGNSTTIEPDINPDDDEDSDESYTEIVHPSASKFIPKDEGEPQPEEVISSFPSRHKINEKPYHKKHPVHQEAKSHHHHHEHHHHESPEHHQKQPHHHHEKDHPKNHKKSHPSKPSREINQSPQKLSPKIPAPKNPFLSNVRNRKKINHPEPKKPMNISSIIPTVKNLVENQNLGNLEKIIVYVDENEGFRKKKRNLDQFPTKVSKKNLHLKNEHKRSKSIGDYQSEELSFDGESLDEMISHVADKILNSVSGSSLHDLDPHLSVKVIQEVSNGSGEPREETKSEFTLDLTDPNLKNLEKSETPRNLNSKKVSVRSRVTSPASKRKMNLPKASGKKRRHWVNKIKRENIVEKIKNKLEMELKKKLNRKRRRVSVATDERPLPHHLDDLDEKIRILYAMHHKKESKNEGRKRKRGQSKSHKRSKRENDWRLDYLESNIFANENDKKSLRALIEQIISLQKNVNTTLQIIRKKLDSPNIIVKKSQSSVLPAISNKKSKQTKVKPRSNSQKSKKAKGKEKVSKKNKENKKKSEKKQKSKKSKAKVTKKKLEKNYGDEQVDKIGNEIQKILEEEEGGKITRKTTKNRRKTRTLKEVSEENLDHVRIGRHLCSKNLQNHKKSGKKSGKSKSSKKHDRTVSKKPKKSKKSSKSKRILRKKEKKREESKKFKKLSDRSQQSIRNVSVPINLRSNNSENCGGCLCDLEDAVVNLKKMLLLRNDLLDRISTYSCQKFTNIGDELVLTSSGVLGDVLPRSRRQIAEAKGLKYVRPGDLEDMLQSDEMIGHDHEILSFPGSDLNIPCNHEGEEITWIMSISRPNYTWTRIDNSPISGTIRKNGNLELYDVDAKDAGNYSCIVTYIDPDNEELVENIYEHNIKIVTLPRYTLRGGNRYKMDVCEETELDVLSSYLPPKLNEILCKNSICDAFIFAPHCHSHQVSIRILIVPTNPSKLLPISTTQCGLRCRKAVQDKIAILLIKNLRIILRKKIVFRIQNRRKDQLVPVDNKMADFTGENSSRRRKKRGRIGRNVKGDADGEVGLLVGCPAGYGLDNSHCVPCSPHYHSQDLSARCKRCPLGTHQPSIGSRVCRTCTNPFVEGCYEMLWTTSSIFLAILAALLAITIISCIVLWILCSRRSRKSSSIHKNEGIEMKKPLIPRLNCSQQSDDEEIIWERPRKKKKKLIKRLLKTNDEQPLVYGINLLPKNQERENNKTIPICCIDSYRSHGGHCHECKHSHYPNTGKRPNFRPPVPFPDFDR